MKIIEKEEEERQEKREANGLENETEISGDTLASPALP